ncbi:MAG: adenylate/guanylate cyclase domain-containing protein [Spirochaetia bacterium]|nr:adenylate/guanylate cyclase domain-containing protein [Spirochaetia bacterium]
MRASPGAIRPFLVSVILVIATLAFSACAQPVLPAPKASAGAMDLRGVDLERPVALDGDWEFHWKRFVDPGAFLDGTAPRADTVDLFPSEWSSYSIAGVDMRGYGTWHLRVRGLKPGSAYGIKASSFLSAAFIYVNGELVDSHGSPGATAAAEKPGWKSSVALFQADPDGVVDLVLHVSNFADRSGGIRTSILFGTPRAVLGAKERAVAYELFVVGAIVVMGAYYLGLFAFRRRDRASLWFGLICLVLGLRVLFYDEYYIQALFPGMTFRALFVGGYLTFTAAAALFAAFVRATFPREFPRIGVLVAVVSSAAYSAVIVAAPTFLSSTILRWYQLCIVVLGLGIAASIVLAAVRRRRGSGLFGLGFLALFGAMVHDVLVSSGVINGTFVLQLGLVGFLFALSLNLTRLFAGAFTMAERLSMDLQRINESLERFVPRQFLGFLKRDTIEDIQLGDNSAEDMAVLFADVRAFTRLAERLSPEETFAFINEYLARTGPAVRAHGSFIDKYLGDGFMALFPGGSEDAVRCALDIQARVAEYNEERFARGQEPVAVGIGVHTGRLMLGTIGETVRMDGTVIADAVNTASRLEGVAKEFGLSVAASECVLADLPDPTLYRMRFIGKVRVKGKTKPVSVFDLYDGDMPQIRDRKDKARADFERGVEAYYERDFDQARERLEAADVILPGDGPTRRYLEDMLTWRGGGRPSEGL